MLKGEKKSISELIKQLFFSIMSNLIKTSQYYEETS